MNNLESGMIFNNARKTFEFMGLEYDDKHPSRMYKRLACFCDYHRDKNKIIIDNVYSKPDYSNYEKRNNDYIYSIGDIFDTPSGKVEIIKKIRYGKVNRKSYICKCHTCSQEYPRYEYNLKKNIGCPVCAGKEVAVGINDMWTTNPKQAELLLYPEDGYKYTQSSGEKVYWKCPICGEIIHRAIGNVKQRGFICPYCERTQSYPNRIMYNLLKYLNIEFENEKVFEWSILENTFKRYDFFIPNFGIIEMMGRQHYEYCNFHKYSGKTVQDEIDNDVFKRNLALNNNISNYLWINCQTSSLEFIRNSILNSEFAKVYDLSNVDWEFIDLESQKNVLEEICNLWNQGVYDKVIIKEKVGLSLSVITKYLNKGNNLGLIEYDKSKTKAEGTKRTMGKHYQSRSNPMFCNENGLYFGSMQICKNTMEQTTGLKFSHANIRGTITGEYSHHHHFTFQYITRSEFNSIKQNPLTSHLAFGDYFISTEQPTKSNIKL